MNGPFDILNKVNNTGLQKKKFFLPQIRFGPFLINFDALISKITSIFVYHVRIFLQINMAYIKKYLILA